MRGELRDALERVRDVEGAAEWEVSVWASMSDRSTYTFGSFDEAIMYLRTATMLGVVDTNPASWAVASVMVVLDGPSPPGAFASLDYADLLDLLEDME